MRLGLHDIPGLSDENQTVHRIKTLSVNEKDRAREALGRWRKASNADWKKLMRSIRYVGTTRREEIRNTKYVKKCDNPKYQDVYEFRAQKGKPRLFFFYDQSDDTVVICTNDYEKDDSRRGKRGGQDAAFGLCFEMKKLYERTRP